MVEASWEIPTFELAHSNCLLQLSFSEQSARSPVTPLIMGSFLSPGDTLGQVQQR